MAYAGQGNTSYLYPWGNTQEMGTRFPQTQHGRSIPEPAEVTAFVPKGDSVFGVSDLIGNVWHYSDVFTDAHTRSVVLRGGANYRPTAPEGLDFYFYSAFQLNQPNTANISYSMIVMSARAHSAFDAPLTLRWVRRNR